MRYRLSCFLGSAALAAILSLPAAAQEYSNGGNGPDGRGPAVLAPVEAYGLHPPGVDPADADRRCSRLRQQYVPYYAPLSPVASTARWAPWGYFPLLPYYTPYYPGYSPHRLFNPRPQPYGCNGWGAGPGPDAPLPTEPGTTPLTYDAYTAVVADDTTYWNMGGNGLVPYGAPQTDTTRRPDLIDAIQASRPGGFGHFHQMAPCPSAIVSPVEAADEQEQGNGKSSRRRAKPAETIPPGKTSN